MERFPSSSMEPEAAPIGEGLQAIEAEEAVLGAVLYNADLFLELASVLNVSDFVLPKHRKVWEAFTRLHNRGQAIDPVTVTEELERMGALEEVGGPAYLAYLMQKVPSSHHALAYAHFVEEMSIRRSMIATAQHMVQLAHKQDVPVDQLLSETEREFFGILTRRLRRDILPLETILNEYYDHLATQAKQTDLIGVPTGFRKLDLLLKGMQPSELIFVAGRPGMGKTAFLLTIARQVAHRGHRVAIFSLEMSAEQVAQRLLAQEAQIRSDRLRTPHQLTADDWSQITQAMDVLGQLSIFVDDTPALTPMQLRAKCRRVQSEYGLDLVMVDYIQLMTAGVRTENRVQEVSYISRMLKHLARDLGVPVLAAAQLSRAVEQRADKRPMLSDLRESGSLEQDADVVMFLYRPEMYEKEDGRGRGPQTEVVFPGQTEIIVAKNRNGPIGTVYLRFKERLATFVEPPALPQDEVAF